MASTCSQGSLHPAEDGVQSEPLTRSQEDPPPKEKRGPFPLWQLVTHREKDGSGVVSWLEEYLEARLEVKVSRGRNYLLRGLDWASNNTLEEVAREQPRGIILKTLEVYVKGVLQKYHTALPLEVALAHPSVAGAKRCTYNAGHGRQVPTRQVLVTLRGEVPASLDLGCWGRFRCRAFVPEPIRCFQCQGFGHYQWQCQQKVVCGVCSGDHTSRDCIRRLRHGEQPAARCPNCTKEHHAWNHRCPARLSRMPRGQPRREAALPPPRPLASAPEPPPQSVGQPASGKRRHRTRKRRKAKAHRDSPSPPLLRTTSAEALPALEEQPSAVVAPQHEQGSRMPKTYAFRLQASGATRVHSEE